MSIPVSVDGVSFNVPEQGERGWAEEVTNLLVELAEVSLLIKGGSIPLTSEADFGASHGLKSIYYKSRTANPAATGVLRLAASDAVKWRNGANSADLSLDISADRLRFEAVNVPTISSTDILTNKTINAALNTLSNIDTTHLAAGVLVTSTALAAASDLNVPSTLAVKTYIDDAVATFGDASGVDYTPTTSSDWPNPDPVNVQEGLDKLAAERALTTTLTAHTSATSGVHGVSGDVVGTTDGQTLTNKNLASATNILTDATAVSFTNVGTITLPNSTSTLATLDLTESLTNKNLGSTTNTLTGATAASFVNAGNTVTLPAATDTLVARDTTDTLTNKTLTSPVINTTLTGTAVETDLSVSASANKVPSAAAAKAYADSLVVSATITNWASYTPIITGWASTSSLDFQYRLVGDTVEILGQFTAGVAQASLVGITMPNSYTANVPNATGTQLVGNAIRDVSDSVNNFTVLVTEGSNILRFGENNSAAATNPAAAANGNALINNGERVIVKAAIPIQ